LKPRKNDAFAAVADPTRRGVLELLRDRGTMTAGEIAAEFPALSRATVSKHVGTLRRARLLRARARGREMRYTLNAAPLAEVYGTWLATFLPILEDSLVNLKHRAEAPES
jgi:DNA-binding transcriptional ArsR family regulator